MDFIFGRTIRLNYFPAHIQPSNAEVSLTAKVNLKASPYSITERRVPEPIPVLVSQPAGDVSHKPGGRPQLPPQPLRGLLPVLLLGEQRHDGCEQLA